MVRTAPFALCVFAVGWMTTTCSPQGPNASPDPDQDISSNARGDASGRALEAGAWGGRGVRLVVTATGADLEFDCAMGSIDGAIMLDAQGSFTAAGEYTPESGGPVSADDPPLIPLPAEYVGSTDGDTMRLTVTITASSEEFGQFELEKGMQAQLEKCL